MPCTLFFAAAKPPGCLNKYCFHGNYTLSNVLRIDDSPINKAADGTDVVSIWFQNEVLQESKMMILDSHRRLVVAHGELQQFLVSNSHK